MLYKIAENEIAENVFYFLNGKRNLLDKWKHASQHLSGDIEFVDLSQW